MPANLEYSAVATGLGKVSFHSNPKETNAKECSNYCIIVLISVASKVILKLLQASLQKYMNRELPDVKLDLEKAEEPENKLPTSLIKQESSIKTSNSASLSTSKPLTVWTTTNSGKFFKRWEYQTT